MTTEEIEQLVKERDALKLHARRLERLIERIRVDCEGLVDRLERTAEFAQAAHDRRARTLTAGYLG